MAYFTPKGNSHLLAIVSTLSAELHSYEILRTKKEVAAATSFDFQIITELTCVWNQS